MNDWRLLGQEKFLAGIELCRRRYVPCNKRTDHDLCEFCGQKFSTRKQDLNEGYAAADGYRWICISCFDDFKDRFGWKVASHP